MGFKLFDELSTEEVAVGAAELSIEEVIAADMAETEVQEVATELAQLNRVIEDGEAMAARLEDQIATEQAIIAQPETVTASTVVLAHESMRVTAAILGADIDATSISQESIEKSPVTALELSIEEKESFLKKIVAQLKAVIAKVGLSIKKLFTKILVAVTNLEKKANSLADNLKGEKPVEIKDEDQDKLIKLIGGGVAVSGDIAQNIDTFKKQGTAGESFVKLAEKLVSALGKLKPGSDDLDSVKAELIKIFNEKDILSSVKSDVELNYMMFTDLIKDDIKDVKDATIVAVPLRYDGSTVKYAKVVIPKKDVIMKGTAKAGIKKATSIFAVSIGTKTVTRSEASKYLPSKTLSKGEAKKVLKSAAAAGKGLKDFSKNIYKINDNANKIVNAIGSLDLGEDMNGVIKPATKAVTFATTTVATDAVLNYYNNVKNTIAAVALMDSIASGEKKKADKEKDK